MSTITQKLEYTQIKASASLQRTVIDSILPKQLPGSIINRISSFTSSDELVHTIRPVSKKYQQLPITTLNINNHIITDEELIDIVSKEKRSLTNINMSKCRKITDLSLKYLSTLLNLTTLDLSDCNEITDAGVKDLSTLKNLTTLNLSWCQNITDVGIKDLSALQNLTTLDLSWCNKITDAGVKDLSALKNLTTLDLSGCAITNAGVKDLSALKNLTTLDLSGRAITDAGVKDLSTLKNLTTLNLSRCDKITDAGVKHLSTLKNLTTLYLSVCDITDAGVKDLSTLKNLITLDLSRCDKITDEGVKDLSILKNLTTLDLSVCSKITDEGVKDLSILKNLTTLDLRACSKITDVGIKDLSALQNLTTLDLSDCNKITDVCVKDLTTLKNLTELDLSWSRITKEVIAENLVKFQNLTKLKLDNGHTFAKGELDLIRREIAEKTILKQFINEKSKKFGIPEECELQFKDTSLGCLGLQININFLYLLTEKDIDSFLLQNDDVQKSVEIFLVKKKPELLEKAGYDLIEWFNAKQFYQVASTDGNKILAKEILFMHATGKLSGMKRFDLIHELGHIQDRPGTKSLGEFDPKELDFIKPHQYREVRADLTAAREENAHEFGIAYFELDNIIRTDPDEHDPHPTAKNRAKAIKIDHDKILKTMSISTY